MYSASPGNPSVGKQVVDLPSPLAERDRPWPAFQVSAAIRRNVISGQLPMRVLGSLPAVGTQVNSVPPAPPAKQTGALVGATARASSAPVSGPLPAGAPSNVIRVARPVGSASGSKPVSGAVLVAALAEQQARAERYATNALKLGILALFLSVLTGIPAIIYGHLARRGVNSLLLVKSKRVQAGWGLALGYLTTIGWAILILVALANAH